MEPVALDVATSRFRERTPLDSDNVGGVVKPGAVDERRAKELDETRRDPAKVAVRDAVLLLELAQDRPIDERLTRVDANAPEASAERVRDTERRVHDVVVEVDQARDVHVSFRCSFRGEVTD